MDPEEFTQLTYEQEIRFQNIFGNLSKEPLGPLTYEETQRYNQLFGPFKLGEPNYQLTYPQEMEFKMLFGTGYARQHTMHGVPVASYDILGAELREKILADFKEAAEEEKKQEAREKLWRAIKTVRNGWGIARAKDKSRAIVYPVEADASIVNLAIAVHLDPNEAFGTYGWVKGAEGSPIRDITEFTEKKRDGLSVPNKIVIAVGGDLNKMSESLLLQMANDVYDAATAKDFQVIYHCYSMAPFSSSQLQGEMKDDLWGFALYGHGMVNTQQAILEGGKGNGAFEIKKSNVPSNDGGTANDIFESNLLPGGYKYAIVIAKLCSAEYSGWSACVSRNGASYIAGGVVSLSGTGYLKNNSVAKTIE